MKVNDYLPLGLLLLVAYPYVQPTCVLQKCTKHVIPLSHASNKKLKKDILLSSRQTLT